MGKDYDKIRQKIGIDKLKTTERKKLFHEFVEHGGQVIEDNLSTKEKLLRSEAVSKKRTQEKQVEKEKPSIALKPSNRITAKSTSAIKKTVRKKKKRAKLRELITLYIRGLLLKVFSARGNRFSDKFIHYINSQVKESYLDLYVTIGSFLDGDNNIKKEVLRLSTSENSVYYEFLVRMSRLYSEEEFNTIVRVISNGELPSRDHFDIFKQFFKRLYILSQYTDLCKLYMDKSIDIQDTKQIINPEIVTSVKAQLRKDINILLLDFFQKFHIIICKLDRAFYPIYSQKLDDYLEITEQDKIGYITREEKIREAEELRRQKELLKQRQQPSEEREQDEIKVPKHVERGFPLLQKVYENFEKQRQTNEGEPQFLLEINDKMYKCSLLLKDFDDQYSFILTTGKITFNIDYREQKKVDIKEDLSNAYLLLCEACEEVKGYLDVIQEMKKTDENIRLTPYQKQKVLDTLSKERSVLSKKSRRRVADVMKTIENTLSIVISDFNSSNRLLQNPDAVLNFDKEIEGEKRLNGKKMIEAIIEAFLFASSFAFLLNFGDLSGSGIHIEPDEGAEN